jgi:hypothetical protein
VCFCQRRWRLRMSVPFMKASLECFCGRASAPSASLPRVASCCAAVPRLLPLFCLELVLVVLCLIVLHAIVHFGLSSSWLVLPQSLFSVADALPLSLFLDGCFAITVARADALPPVSLGSPLCGRCFAAEGVMAPIRGCFAAIALLGRMFCRHCCSSGCFAAGIASVSPLWQMLCCRGCDGPIRGCFAASSLADALPPR